MSEEHAGALSEAVLRSEGFAPLEDLTGWLELGEVWPADHCRVLTESWRERQRPVAADSVLADGDTCWVRSPWAIVGTEEAVLLLQRWVRRHRPATPPTKLLRIDRKRELELASEFLARDERWIRAYREGHVRPER